MDGSTRSSHSNAFQYGFCSNKRIVLFDTLLTQANTDEIVAILAHELGHWKYNHTVQSLIISEIQIFVIFAFFSFVYKNLPFYQSFGFNRSTIIIGLILFQFVWSPMQAISSFLMNTLTRYYEYQADAFACRLGYDDALYQGLIKIHSENKSNLNPDSLYSIYHHSHPPLILRLQAIQMLQKQMK